MRAVWTSRVVETPVESHWSRATAMPQIAAVQPRGRRSDVPAVGPVMLELGAPSALLQRCEVALPRVPAAPALESEQPVLGPRVSVAWVL